MLKILRDKVHEVLAANFSKLNGKEFQFLLPFLGDWDKCYEILTEFTSGREPYFDTCSSKDDTCPNAGIKMPPIPMQNSEFYGFSEYWYSMEEVLGMGKKHLLKF